MKKQLLIWAISIFTALTAMSEEVWRAARIETLTGPAPENESAKFDISAHNKQIPAFKMGARLLFIGDSITDMNRGRNEKDRNHYLGHSFVFMLAGRLGMEMPEAQLDFYNRGISGNTVAQLKARWQADAIALRPDVLTILIGTNDVGKQGPARCI